MKKRAISAKGQQHVDVCVQTLKTVDARSCGQFSKAGGVQVSCVSWRPSYAGQLPSNIG